MTPVCVLLCRVLQTIIVRALSSVHRRIHSVLWQDTTDTSKSAPFVLQYMLGPRMYLLHASVVDNHAQKAESLVFGPSMSYSLHTIHSIAVRNSVECEPERGLPVLSGGKPHIENTSAICSVNQNITPLTPIRCKPQTSYLIKPCAMLQPGRLSTNKEDVAFGKRSPSYGGRHTAGGMSYHFRMHGKMTMIPLSRLILEMPPCL
jgi:hypothetical protein